jgi:hypothetical protein
VVDANIFMFKSDVSTETEAVIFSRRRLAWRLESIIFPKSAAGSKSFYLRLSWIWTNIKPRFQAWQKRLFQSKDPNARIHESETKLAKRSEARSTTICFFFKYLKKKLRKCINTKFNIIINRNKSLINMTKIVSRVDEPAKKKWLGSARLSLH